MSMKNGKRSRRKTDEIEDFKAPIPSIKKDVTNKSDDKLIENDSEELKGFDVETNGSENFVKTQSHSQSNSSKTIITEEEPTSTETQTITETHTTTEETTTEEQITTRGKQLVTSTEEVTTETITEVTVTETAEVVKALPIINEGEISTTNATDKETNGSIDDIEAENVEAETPVVEEEPELELQFDENSDKDSRKDSPILSRCYTRRSQTRNIPTPKTPKSILDNCDEKEIEKVVERNETNIVNDPEIRKIDTKDEEFEFIDLNETRESFESAASTKVNVGNDLTQDIDLSVPTEFDDKSNDSSFLASAKDMTVVETIRKMSSRRAIRPVEDYRKYILRSNAERGERSFEITQPQRSSVERLSGVKRKSRCDTPDSMKRFKPEPIPGGFLSFISSPINKIRNRFSPTSSEVSASTPKLTGYKNHILEHADVSKIGIDDPIPEKKWCSIM